MTKKRRSKKPREAGLRVARKSVSLAAVPWDLGADGPANRVGLVIEEAAEMTPNGRAPNPNRVIRMRRDGILEQWHSNYLTGRRDPRSNDLRPYLTTRQYTAAQAYEVAFERTQRGVGWPDTERVQSSSKPDVAIIVQMTNREDYARIIRCIDSRDRQLLDAWIVTGLEKRVTGNAYRRGHAHMRAALDRLADALRLSGEPEGV